MALLVPQRIHNPAAMWSRGRCHNISPKHQVPPARAAGTMGLMAPQRDLQVGVRVTLAQRATAAFISPLGTSISGTASFCLHGIATGVQL